MYLKGTFSGWVGLYMILTLLVFSMGFAVSFHIAPSHGALAYIIRRCQASEAVIQCREPSLKVSNMGSCSRLIIRENI